MDRHLHRQTKREADVSPNHLQRFGRPPPSAVRSVNLPLNAMAHAMPHGKNYYSTTSAPILQNKRSVRQLPIRRIPGSYFRDREDITNQMPGFKRKSARSFACCLTVQMPG